jgi:RNA polymerase sigma-70 factor (ECF subfamily)
MLAAIPKLRAFAWSLSRSAYRTDDLVQQTLLRACSNVRQFEPGTNRNAWLITILRNEFYNDQRRRRREVEDVDGKYAETLVTQAEQVTRVEFDELHDALAGLPDPMQKVLVLTGAWGLSHADAARVCACPEGTLKSRLSRARTRLAAMLSLDASPSFGEDAIARSVAVQAEQGRLQQAG